MSYDVLMPEMPGRSPLLDTCMKAGNRNRSVPDGSLKDPIKRGRITSVAFVAAATKKDAPNVIAFGRV